MDEGWLRESKLGTLQEEDYLIQTYAHQFFHIFCILLFFLGLCCLKGGDGVSYDNDNILLSASNGDLAVAGMMGMPMPNASVQSGCWKEPPFLFSQGRNCVDLLKLIFNGILCRSYPFQCV